MLQSIRDNIQGVMAKVIIAIIIVPFAIFGIESLVSGSGTTAVAKVNGEKISNVELQQAITVQKRRTLATMGDKAPPNMLDDAMLRGPVLDGLITQHLLQQSADAMKLSMPEQIVDQTILTMAPFQEAGKFSPERYQLLLRNQGYTPAYFQHMLQQELLVSQLHSGLAESEFVTPKELQVVAGLLQQQRSFHYLTIPLAPLADKTVVSDTDAQGYYHDHQDQFLREEQVQLDYIELHATDFYPTVDDAAAKAEYDREMADFSNATERRAAHISIEVTPQRNEQQARELAESIVKKIAAGEDFGKLAGQYSDDLGSKSNGGDLGVSAGDVFPPLFEKTLAGLKVGEVSAPVKSEAGFELIKLVAEHTKERPTFEQKKAEIVQRLQQSGAQPRLLKTVEKLRDLVFNSDGLKGPAEQLKLSVRQSGWLDRKTSDPLFGNPKIVAAAFSSDVLKDGNNSEVLELSPDHYLVLRVSQHQAPAPKPFDQVKPDIVAMIKRQRATADADKTSAGLMQQLQQGVAFDKVATQAGYTARSAESATRNSGGVPPELLRSVFAMPHPVQAKPLPVMTISTANGDIALLQLEKIADGSPESLSTAQRTAITTQLQQGFGAAGFAAFMENLRARADIKRD